MPRGGFSGGMVLSEHGYVLGVITSALESRGKASDSGFMTAVAVEPIYHCLSAHGMLPPKQAEMWEGLFDDIADEPAYQKPNPIGTIRHMIDDQDSP
jgi:hypothetical protein